MKPGRVRRVDEARLALTFLTRLPAGRIADPVPTLAEARWVYPLVGLMVGGIGWAAQHGSLALGFGALLSAFVALAVMALVTGGLHHDGLADFADGVGGGRDGDHSLEIMRDSRIGSYGVLALLFALALAGGALSTFTDGASLALFLMLGVSSRLAMLVTLDLLPSARNDGLGRLAAGQRLDAWVPGLLVIFALGLLGGPSHWLVLPGVAAAAFLIARLARKRLGGQTGDVLGAVQLSSEVLGWLTATALLAGR